MSRNPWNPAFNRPAPNIAVCQIKCKCGKLVLAKESGGVTYCKSCGRAVTASILSHMYCTVDELEADLGNGTSPDTSDELLGKVSYLEKSLADKEAELAESCTLIDQYRDRIRSLECDLRKSNIRETEFEDLRRDGIRVRESLESRMEAMESELNMYRRENRQIVSENKALEETNRHLHSEINRSRDLDLRAVMSIFMEYAANVNNLVAEEEDRDHMKKMVSARTMHMIMKLKGAGVSVTHHSPGEPLREGRVDVTETFTDDPGKDMTVFHSNTYGCSFRNDVYAPIVENVIVNRFVQKKEEEQ